MSRKIDFEYNRPILPLDGTVTDLTVGTVIVSDAPIDDNTTSPLSVWSSEKIQETIITEISTSGITTSEDDMALMGDNGGDVVIGASETGGQWNTAHLRLGPYHLWVDSLGMLRIKNDSPASDTDGTVIGTQT